MPTKPLKQVSWSSALGPVEGLPVEILEYGYSPINPNVDSIRLLILEPAESFESKIFCRLELVELVQKPTYDALSYTWGDELATQDIWIEGLSLPVRSNLSNALRSLRSATESRTLWIDVICINQRDYKERNDQIKLMPFVYKGARTVLVWLGVFPDIKHTELCWEILFGASEEKSDSLQNASSADLFLRTLCDNAYWRRVWIVQEICLAQHVQVCYGYLTTSWASFIKEIQRHHDLQDSFPMKLQDQRSRSWSEGYELDTLIIKYQDTLCKDPRDHIFGFLGLATDAIHYPVGYNRSLSQVWKDAVKYKQEKTVSQRRSDKNCSPLHCDDIEFASVVQQLLIGSCPSWLSSELPW